eukprot:CAMPEP_0170485214 /NCGR_PEP_ID=MMETSP0208-20121228/4528_1 /TAXON_ID=197538 /ORGANISM="Strombidium inclinatum, Strain S3" /LENGTH=87 /DNA_ID=CAMNT_0010758791 /DNA_START=124 /DNA_END=387 /DNA_ORIENTATION=+
MATCMMVTVPLGLLFLTRSYLTASWVVPLQEELALKFSENQDASVPWLKEKKALMADEESMRGKVELFSGAAAVIGVWVVIIMVLLA